MDRRTGPDRTVCNLTNLAGNSKYSHLQLPESVLVEEEEGECVRHRDEGPRPQRDGLVGQQVERRRRPNDLLGPDSGVINLLL